MSSIPLHWLNDDDFRMKCIPSKLSDFWDYSSNPTYGILEAMIRSRRLPRLLILYGPPGTGKTAAAYLLGCASSCDYLDPTTRLPCGECASCRQVRLGKGEMTREALIEIDCADRALHSRPIDDFYAARSHTASYRSAKPGDKSLAYIVFGDEVQRLMASDREALLKLIEKWAGAHIILATTDLNRLALPGPDDQVNPLLSRATQLRMNSPSAAECVPGIIRIGTQNGLEVHLDAAQWITEKHRCSPRDCLGELYVLSSFEQTISMELIRKVYRLSKPDDRGPNPNGVDGDDIY